MKYKSNLQQCTELQACQEALNFVEEKYGDVDFSLTDVTPKTLNWALWLLYHLDRKLLINFNCDCAEHVLHFYEDVHPDDNRVRNCIKLTRRWNKGEASDEELKKARGDTRAVVWDAAEAAAWDAVGAAWEAAGAAAGATTGAAAGATAEAAACATAEAAACAAAGAAERQWQVNRLIEIIKTRSVR